MEKETQLHAIPLWLLREYLEELGGEAQTEERVSGDGWEASLKKMPPRQTGSLRVGIVQITIEGTSAALDDLRPRLQKMTMRGGA